MALLKPLIKPFSGNIEEKSMDACKAFAKCVVQFQPYFTIHLSNFI